MEHYIVSARKYRPSTFDTVIGQKPLTAALKHAVATDRLAHAYLFCGSRGVGKTSCARIFAKTINCSNRTANGEACNECESCRAFNSGASLNIIELDAASHNGVDDMRSLTEQVLIPPTSGRYRVFIIDEVHMLSPAAFNAFLKTLEEPPEYVIFILATTEKHKIIPTILSRCQIYDFSRITIQDMVDHLTSVAQKENIVVEPSALNVIARKADGAMRDALSIFDQVAASTMGQVTYANTIENLNILDNTYYTRLVQAFLSCDVPTALLIYQEIRNKGFDSQFFINGLAQYLRDLMVAGRPETIKLLEASDDVRAEMAAMAAKCQPRWMYAAMDLCNTADLNYKAATNKQFLVELTLIKMCQLVDPATAKPGTAHPVQPLQAQGGAAGTPQQAAPTAAPQVHPASTQPQATAQQPAPQAAAPQQAAYQQQYRQPQAPQQQAAVRQTMPRRSSLPSFSIKGDTQKPADEESQAPADPSHRRSERYTPEQLAKAWDAFIANNPSESILINVLRSAPPVAIGNDKYRLEVDSDLQVKIIEQWRLAILQHMRDTLGNDNIDFTIAIRQGESSPVTWTQREVLQHMIEKNSELGSLINDLALNM